MKFRSLPAAIAIAAALAVPLTALVPAYADPPADPVFSSLDSSVAGHLTGTITSAGVPEIYVRFANTAGVQYRHVTLAGDSDSFDLPTWGYAGSTTIYAYACLTTAQTAGECSTPTPMGSFTPTDVTPTVTWSSDTTIGPADQVTVTGVTDTGGGLLFAQFDNDVPIPDPPRFALVDNAVANLEDGFGQIVGFRCDDLNPDQCASFDAQSPAYDVRQQLHLTYDTVTKITAGHPDTSVQLHVIRPGTYDLTWHLAFPAGTDPGVSDSVTGGTITGTDLAPITIPGAALTTSGSYLLEGTLTVHGSDAGFDGDYVLDLDGSPAVSPTVTVDRTGPSLTSVTASPTTIYPRILHNSTYRSWTTFAIFGTGLPNVVAAKLYKRTGTGDTFQRTLTIKPGVNSLHGTAVWTGLLSGGVPAPAGLYVVKFEDSDGNASSRVGSVTVSSKKLVTKTWTRTFSPAGTLADSYVGKCSTLREPSLRGWYHSFGYYANTRCASQTSKDSLISTLHVTFLPKAVQYVDIHVNAYGGAARAKPGSKARIRYLTTSTDPAKQWASTRTISSTLGTHAGYTRSTSGLVFKDRSFGWGIYTGFGYQYDIKSFTVVLHYKVLG